MASQRDPMEGGMFSPLYDTMYYEDTYQEC